MTQKLVVGLIALLVALDGAPAKAQQRESARQLVMSVSNITAKDQAAASKRPADSLRASLPGDVMEYRMVFTNTKRVTARGVKFDNAIPRSLAYALGSATTDRADAQVEYSINGGKTFTANPMVEVIEAGQKVRRPAPPEMYTHVQWRITGAVEPGARIVARYRARVKGPADTASSR